MGGSEVRQLRMVERHYFKDKLLKSFDFDFGFCMPYSRNSCEHIYEMPELTPQEGQQLLCIPYCLVHVSQLKRRSIIEGVGLIAQSITCLV